MNSTPKAVVPWKFTVLAAFALGLAPGFCADKLPATDQRAGPPKTLDTPRAFPEIASKSAWKTRAADIRQHVLVSCGLWPMPEKTPLNAHIFGRIERGGYSVEKVYFQTSPGFYLAGNLYRPLGQGPGPFPGILNPHGHWSEGRMADRPSGSIAARCINFARQGMVAFSYDMVGYNDTAQVTHKFAASPTNLLWNISLMGLQTWNSIRALDFLEALPDVDKSRLACTGESGGGTQTFMLGAIDDRLAVQAPVVMVSHSMQGGCLCENAPGLRVDYSNMEIAAVPAPRRQILVAATGDWTKTTMTLEGPALQSIYRLFKAEDNLRFTIFNFDHNYNKTSREAVYAWFDHCLLRAPESAAVTELAYQKEPNEDLRVWPDGKLPADALTEGQLIQFLIQRAQTQLRALQPTDARSLKQFKEVMLPAWRHTLQAEAPDNGLLIEPGETRKAGACTAQTFAVGRAGKGDRLPVLLLTPAENRKRATAVLAHPEGKSAFLDRTGSPQGLARQLLDRGCAVVLVDTFLTGELANAEALHARNHTSHFFCTYNRTDLQERVQDLVTTCAFARRQTKSRTVVLCGQGRAGLWALLAAPAANAAVMADGAALDPADSALMEQDLFVPGLRKLGGFETAAMLAVPSPLLVHNTGPKFSTQALRESYAAAHRENVFRAEADRVPDTALADWAAGMGTR